MVRLFTRIFSRPGKENEPPPEPAQRSEPRLPLPETPAEAPERDRPPPSPQQTAPLQTAPVQTEVPEPAAPLEPPVEPPVEPSLDASPAAPVLESRRWGPAKGAHVENVVFLCHGMGANAEGIIQIAPQLSTLLQTTLFVAPNGPGYAASGDGRVWFDGQDRSPAALEAGARRAATLLDALIDAELDQAGVNRDAYALVGYSQGAMTVLFTGLRRRPPPRAILSFAGALIAPGSLEAEISGRVPVMLVHGLEDPIVPAFYSRDAEKALRALGVPVQALYAPRLGHAIDGSVVQAGKQFLARSLASDAALASPARPSPGG